MSLARKRKLLDLPKADTRATPAAGRPTAVGRLARSTFPTSSASRRVSPSTERGRNSAQSDLAKYAYVPERGRSTIFWRERCTRFRSRLDWCRSPKELRRNSWSSTSVTCRPLGRWLHWTAPRGPFARDLAPRCTYSDRILCSSSVRLCRPRKLRPPYRSRRHIPTQQP